MDQETLKNSKDLIAQKLIELEDLLFDLYGDKFAAEAVSSTVDRVMIIKEGMR